MQFSALVLMLVVAMAVADDRNMERINGKWNGTAMAECRHMNRFYYTHNVRHESDCHKFYKCIGGYGFEMFCPTLKGVQLVFNEDVRVCAWEGVPCHGQEHPKPTTQEPSTQEPTHPPTNIHPDTTTTTAPTEPDWATSIGTQ